LPDPAHEPPFNSVPTGLVTFIETEFSMTNPFESNEALYRVLINHENQYSIWPELIEVPAGWKIIHGPAQKAACLEFIEANWTDMRPRSLAEAMDAPK